MSQVMHRLFSFLSKKSTPSQVYPRQTHPARYLSTTDLPYSKDVTIDQWARSCKDWSPSHQRNPHPARYIQDKLTQLGISQPTYLIAKTWSMSQVMQRLVTFSSKKSTPSQVYPRQTHPVRYLSTTDLPYSKDVINEPGHAETVQLLIEEIHTQPGISKTNSPS